MAVYVTHEELVKEIKLLQEQINDLMRRVDNLANQRIDETQADLTTTQMAIADAYEQTITEEVA